MTDAFYAPLARSPITYLDGAITDSQTTIDVINASLLPAAPNVATIGGGSSSETIKYTGKTGNQLTGVTRGFSPTGSASAWDDGTAIARVLTDQDISALQGAVEDLETDFGTLTGLPDDLDDHIENEAPHMEAVSMERSDKDADGIYQTIEWSRSDGTLYKDSILSVESDVYTQRTVRYYDTDGTTVLKTVVYDLTYDESEEGELISEVINNE